MIFEIDGIMFTAPVADLVAAIVSVAMVANEMKKIKEKRN